MRSAVCFSLSVEEQFYWAWPFVILLLRGRALLPAVLSMISATVLLKYFLAISGAAGADTYGYLFRSLPSCLDSLGAGAALAIVRARQPMSNEPIFGRAIAIACASLFVSLTAYRSITTMDPWYTGQHAFGVLYFHSVILVSLVAIDWATSRRPPWFKSLFEHPFMTFTGKISYGMYVYHFFLLVPSASWFPPTLIGESLTLVLLIASVYLVASASFFLIERPLLKLKDKVS